MSIRALIVDDEQLARDRLRQLLQNEAEIEIAGECADGREAVAAIKKCRPDLVFLDVQMPELDGFGVLEAVGEENMPAVVFVTAHDRFALRAFEVHAVDYLLKPFDQERFQKALRRAVEQARNRDKNTVRERQSALLADWQSSQIAVKSAGSVFRVKLEDIDWIGSADNYAELHVGAKSHLLRETLGALETRLAPESFVRISRSAIVNTQRIQELRRLFYGGYEIILHDGTRLTLSRRQRAKLKELGLV
ncbi:MAG: LytR/AlgR family response regulator transcription factor [Limisphaerales bacterium]